MIGKEIGSGILKGMLHKRLEAANREANLYLDIMTHDIKNAENVSSLYADLLIEMLGGEAALYVRKIQSSIRKSAEILSNVPQSVASIRSRLTSARSTLMPSFRGEIAAFPDVVIEFEVRPARSGQMISSLEVFANLIRNAVKLGGPEIEITIRVEDV